MVVVAAVVVAVQQEAVSALPPTTTTARTTAPAATSTPLPRRPTALAARIRSIMTTLAPQTNFRTVMKVRLRVHVNIFA